ncbi:unnamed protein product [Caenorhabditis brenneri]
MSQKNSIRFSLQYLLHLFCGVAYSLIFIQFNSNYGVIFNHVVKRLGTMLDIGGVHIRGRSDVLEFKPVFLVDQLSGFKH